MEWLGLLALLWAAGLLFAVVDSRRFPRRLARATLQQPARGRPSVAGRPLVAGVPVSRPGALATSQRWGA
jgi:hypothetical protein